MPFEQLERDRVLQQALDNSLQRPSPVSRVVALFAEPVPRLRFDLQDELALRIGCYEGAEVGASSGRGRFVAVDPLDLHGGGAPAVIAADGGLYQIATPQRELAHELWRDEGIAGYG